ncbi:MAG: hypothetical protein KDD36_06375, partial [Flavobacteriales bacterium]|nr:hypothetical protein [Flavobacteriales bacterium]
MDSSSSKPEIIEEDESDNHLKYPFIEKLHALGFGTDTNRLHQLAYYAYPELKTSPFNEDGNALVCQLDIHNSRVLKRFPTGDIASVLLNSLHNGKGFFFVEVDTNGVGLKNSFDFGMELWDYTEMDSSLIRNAWKEVYFPMPVRVDIINGKM